MEEDADHGVDVVVRDGVQRGHRRELTAIEAAPGVLVEPDDYWQVILAQVEEGLV